MSYYRLLEFHELGDEAVVVHFHQLDFRALGCGNAVTVKADAFSKSAIAKIEAAGGKAVVNE